MKVFHGRKRVVSVTVNLYTSESPVCMAKVVSGPDVEVTVSQLIDFIAKAAASGSASTNSRPAGVTRSEVMEARELGYQSVGKGISDCPYVTPDMEVKDNVLADAWIRGLRAGETQERIDLAASEEQRNDLSNAPDLLVPVPPPVREYPKGDSAWSPLWGCRYDRSRGKLALNLNGRPFYLGVPGLQSEIEMAKRQVVLGIDFGEGCTTGLLVMAAEQVTEAIRAAKRDAESLEARKRFNVDVALFGAERSATWWRCALHSNVEIRSCHAPSLWELAPWWAVKIGLVGDIASYLDKTGKRAVYYSDGKLVGGGKYWLRPKGFTVKAESIIEERQQLTLTERVRRWLS